MRVPDLEYLIEEAENQKEDDFAAFAEAYYYHLEMVRAAVTAPQLLNRKEIHQMEKDARKKREYQKLKKRLLDS